jgi:hypothetical protein
MVIEEKWATTLTILIFNHIQSYSIIFNHIQSYSIIFNHIQAYSIIFNHIQSYSIILNHIQAYSSIFNHIQSYPIIFNHIQSYSIIFNHILSYSIIFNHIQSYHIQSYSIVVSKCIQALDSGSFCLSSHVRPTYLTDQVRSKPESQFPIQALIRSEHRVKYQFLVRSSNR